MWKLERDHIPIKKALLTIFLLTLLISGSTGFSLLLYFHLKELARDPNERLIAIQQSGPDKDTLPSTYFIDLLNLSEPESFNRLDLQKAGKKLLTSPYIKTIDVKKIEPGILSIYYSLHHPVAVLVDCSLGDSSDKKWGLDAEGFVFPLAPYFCTQPLAEIVVNGENRKECIPLALFLLNHFQEYTVQQIDLSKIETSGEIVVMLQEEIIQDSQRYVCPTILLLSTENYRQQLVNYKVLRKYLEKQEKKLEDSGVLSAQKIDLRISKLAFLRT